MKALRRFTVRAHLPERLTALERLSTNLRRPWDVPTQDLFATIDSVSWDQLGQDPVALPDTPLHHRVPAVDDELGLVTLA